VTLQVLVEVAGCATTCMHCWLGGAYGAMPIDDAACALEELERFCRERDVDAWLDRRPD
jgi:hypothetical protein